jgi:predicted permease
MVSYGSWMTRFGGDRNLIGKTITLGDSPYVVVGILQREFHFSFLGKPEIWVPITGSRPCEKRRSCHNLFAVGRMKDGVQFETVQAKLATLARQLEQQFPDSNRGQGANVRPLVQVAAERVRPILLVMLAGALLLLLISYLNVAALLLVRAENRRREVAIRGALGASSGRLLCQFVTEGVALITGGAVMGLLIANWAIKGMLALIPQRMMIALPYLDNLGLNWHSYVGTVALSLLAAILFSAIPSLYVTGASLGTGLAEGSRGSAGLAWRRLGSRLVILEFAAAMVLLTGAGLIGKSLYQLLHVDIGLRADHVAAIAFRAPSASYDTPEKQVALEREVLTILGRMPELESVAAGSQMPVSFNGNTNWIRIEGQPYNGEHNEVNNRQVSPAYFSTIGAKLARGRYFNVSDDSTHPNVVIVNQALVRKHFPNGEDPIGKRIGDTQLSARSIQTIVGVVEDVRDGALDSEIWPAVYECSLQSPDSEFTIFARTRVPPELVLQPMRAVLRQQYPTAAINNEISMEDQILQSPTSYMHRSSAYLVGVFAAVALILGIVGLYGVVAYSVGQRTREIGIRMALGAVPQAVRRLILRESAALIGIAVLLGAAGSIGGATVLRGFFFRVAAWDFTALLGVTVVLVAAALIAAYLPARRAASVNPVDVLRSE